MPFFHMYKLISKQYWHENLLKLSKDSTQGQTKPLHSSLGCMGGIPYAANLGASYVQYKRWTQIIMSQSWTLVCTNGRGGACNFKDFLKFFGGFFRWSFSHYAPALSFNHNRPIQHQSISNQYSTSLQTVCQSAHLHAPLFHNLWTRPRDPWTPLLKVGLHLQNC